MTNTFLEGRNALNETEKPCLVQTPQGFSVSYKNHFLYSKYNPSKLILQKINELTILPGTIILCFGCYLPYGIKELLEKLDETSFLCFCEFDKNLQDFQKENLNSFFTENDFKEYSFLDTDEIYNLPLILNKREYTFKNGGNLKISGTYKRVIRLDFSAGTSFSPKLYDDLTKLCSQSLMTFWSNRMTLLKFGRRYCKNLFINLQNYKNSTPIEKFFFSINKTIIVFGAGESSSFELSSIKQNRAEFFILCVDTALKPLIASGIIPDGVFVEECQTIISKAFTGCKKHNIQIFQSYSSLPSLKKVTSPENISYFTSKFCDSVFLEKLINEEILKTVNPPFGSVGLSSVFYALKFRKNDNIPVFVYGLDFAYSSSQTHMKGALSNIQNLFQTNRITALGTYKSAFNKNSIKFLNKAGNEIFTNPVMKNYSLIFSDLFANTKNLFNASDFGMDLHIPYKKPEFNKTVQNNDPEINVKIDKKSFEETCLKINEYCLEEKEALEELRNLLTKKSSLSEKELLSKIKDIAEKREYLYLHFPDGWKFSTDLSFLKRMRTQIDYFLKYL